MLTSRRTSCAAFAVIILLLSACSSAPAPTESPSEALLPIKVVLPPFLSNAPIFIAQEEGYFTDAGLIVEVVTLDRGIDSFPALVQGQVDVTSDALNVAIFSAIAQGSDVRLVANKGIMGSPECAYHGMLASPDAAAAGGLDNPDLAQGTKLASNEANWSEFAMDAVLASHGLTRDLFDSVSVPQSAMGETLAGGDIAFGVSGEPWITRITQAGQGVLIDKFEVAQPGFQYSFVSFGPSLLRDNPEVGRRFMVAYIRGVRQFSEGKTDRNVEIIAKVTELDTELVRQMCWPTFSEDAVMNADDVQTFQKWAVSKGYLDAVTPTSEVIDSSFQQYAVEQLAP